MDAHDLYRNQQRIKLWRGSRASSPPHPQSASHYGRIVSARTILPRTGGPDPVAQGHLPVSWRRMLALPPSLGTSSSFSPPCHGTHRPNYASLHHSPARCELAGHLEQSMREIGTRDGRSVPVRESKVNDHMPIPTKEYSAIQVHRRLTRR